MVQVGVVAVREHFEPLVHQRHHAHRQTADAGPHALSHMRSLDLFLSMKQIMDSFIGCIGKRFSCGGAYSPARVTFSSSPMDGLCESFSHCSWALTAKESALLARPAHFGTGAALRAALTALAPTDPSADLAGS